MTKKDNVDIQGLIKLHTSNKQSTIRLRAVPLPSEVTSILENSADLLKTIDPESMRALDNKESIQSALSSRTLEAINVLKQKLQDAFTETEDKQWTDAVDHIWSFGPRRCGPNILLNRVPDFELNSIWSCEQSGQTKQHHKYESSFINGFQLATLSGPLCEEPMMGVCFIIEDWTFKGASEDDSSAG